MRIYQLFFLSLLMFGLSNLRLAGQVDYARGSLDIEDMLEQMTLEEKIGQMIQLNLTTINNTGENNDVTLNEQKVKTLIKSYHIGSFLNGVAVPPAQWYTYMSRLQMVATNASRLNIPILYGIDHIHGASYLGGATIFPQNINLAATFNDVHAQNMGAVTVEESADLGHHWIFAPVLDLGINPYWPRFWETFGEDPLVASRMGASFIRNVQNPANSRPYRVAACAKHFIGYSDPRSGYDRTPVHVPDQYLQEFFRPSFQAAIDAGVKTVMVNSGEINGVPVHASKRILTDLLRTEMGFDGVVITDWGDIIKLVRRHRVAHNEKEATFLAISAGVDMAMTATTTDFCDHLKALVLEGRIAHARIDSSVRRILKLKKDLGLFEGLMPRNDRFDRVGHPDHRGMALEAARESIVLLKNDTILDKPVLPLSNDTRIILAGPSADSKRNLSGGWTIEWQGSAEAEYPDWVPTIRDEISRRYQRVLVPDNVAEMRKMKNDADIIVLALGEAPYTEFEGNIDDLSLPPEQMEWMHAALDSDIPVIVIMIAGRPRTMDGLDTLINAFVWAGLPGFEGARAIADVLDGTENPGGKLPFSYPSSPGHYNAYHHKHTDISTARFQFGDGMGYSRVEYSKLELSDTLVGGICTARVSIQNASELRCHESVLWFISDEYGKITRPVKQLKHYAKVELDPGESTTLVFNIDPNEHLTYPDAKGSMRLEEGYFTLKVGDQSSRFYYKEQVK